jgi:hypothetical protein
MDRHLVEARPGGSQGDGGGFVGEPLAGSLGRGQAPPLHSGGPPPRLVIAPHVLCPFVDLALRSTRRPTVEPPGRTSGTGEGTRE